MRELIFFLLAFFWYWIFNLNLNGRVVITYLIFLEFMGVIFWLSIFMLLDSVAWFVNPLEIGTNVEELGLVPVALWISRLFIALFAFFLVLHIYFCLFSTSPCNASSAGVLMSILISVLLPILFAKFNMCCFCAFTWWFFNVKHARVRKLHLIIACTTFDYSIIDTGIECLWNSISK